MGEILRTNPIEHEPEEKKNTVELRGFPESVTELFNRLPDYIKEEIIPTGEKKEVENPVFKKWLEDDILEDIVSRLNREDREDFISNSLGSLFRIGDLRKTLLEKGVEGLKQETARLLDLLWGNRGKRGDDVKLFNQEHYERLSRERGAITQKIQSKKSEVEELRASMEKTRKQRRLTRTKQQSLYELQEELRELETELEKHDSKETHHVGMRFGELRDIPYLRRKERDWTECVATISEYLDPSEFATVMAEQFDKAFYAEVDCSRRDPEKDRRYFSAIRFTEEEAEQAVERSRKIVDSFVSAIEEWNQKHQNETSFKKPSEIGSEEQRRKLIDYFISLAESYKRRSIERKTDEDMIYTIRQMEVTLRILGR